ncbi:hypothetical protein [Scale drop disease virus]|uniref:ORF_093R n=1 Tax=Scale drop disease virus TaxID=1697349 RepID=A0A0K1L6W9_9VIRU|nr:ORF_093R [Scale drop disease virus]AKU37508.1 ORF_093R [Scale drop disease virus]QLI60767.1 hypothetical protein [Scale drop disease virus]QXJ13685.1 ORF093R [Scale drop disease virus]UNH60688.1 hypothetical protein SDDV_ORF019 [Scale drop disease virus]
MADQYNQFVTTCFTLGEVSGDSVEENGKVPIPLGQEQQNIIDLGFNTVDSTYMIVYSIFLSDVSINDASKLQMVLSETIGEEVKEVVITPAYREQKKVWFNGMHVIKFTAEKTVSKVQFMYKFLEAINARYTITPDENTSSVIVITSKKYNRDNYVKMQLPVAVAAVAAE